MPKRAVFERSRRELSLDISVDIHILLVVEQSSLESQSRGCAKTPILTGTVIQLMYFFFFNGTTTSYKYLTSATSALLLNSPSPLPKMKNEKKNSICSCSRTIQLFIFSLAILSICCNHFIPVVGVGSERSTLIGPR